MAKNRNIGLIIGIVIMLIIAVPILLLATLPVVKNTTYYDDSNTVEHSATVKNIISKDKGYEIEVDEYSCILYVSKKEVVDEKSLIELSDGDKIMFNIFESFDKALTDNDLSAMWVVALKTENAAIVTFESHSERELADYKECQITGIVGSSLLFCGVAVCLFFLLKPKRNTADLSR